MTDLNFQTKIQHGVMMLQPKCNMTCSFCITEDTMDTMSYTVAESLLRDFKRRGFSSAIFGGGEPFFWPHDLKSILQFAKSLGLTTQIGTNAIKMPHDLASWNFVDRWVIPIDGASRDVHNGLRKFRARHWDIVTHALELLQIAGKSTTISTVLTTVNRHEILEIGEYLRRLQNLAKKPFLHAWHLYRFLPFGRGGRINRQHLEIPQSEYETLVRQVRELNLPFKVFKRENMQMSKTVEFYWVESGKLMAQSGTRGVIEMPTPTISNRS